MFPACEEEVSDPSTISYTGSRSRKSVGCRLATGPPSQVRPASRMDQTMLRRPVVPGARPIGVDKVPGDSAAVGEVWFVGDLTLASSASSSKMRCWLAVSATGCVGNQDRINWATSLAMY